MASESSSGKYDKKETEDFNKVVEELRLCEFDSSGPCFSFSKNSTPPVLHRLDRFFANIEWMELFPSMVKKS